MHLQPRINVKVAGYHFCKTVYLYLYWAKLPLLSHTWTSCASLWEESWLVYSQSYIRNLSDATSLQFYKAFMGKV